MLARNPSRSAVNSRNSQKRRQFGTDVTNCYRPDVEAKCFSFLETETSGTPTYAFEIELVESESRNPLCDHLDDIMSYTLDQSFGSFIQEDYMPWHTEINQSMREILVNWLIRVQV